MRMSRASLPRAGGLRLRSLPVQFPLQRVQSSSHIAAQLRPLPVWHSHSIESVLTCTLYSLFGFLNQRIKLKGGHRPPAFAAFAFLFWVQQDAVASAIQHQVLPTSEVGNLRVEKLLRFLGGVETHEVFGSVAPFVRCDSNNYAVAERGAHVPLGEPLLPPRLRHR